MRIWIAALALGLALAPSAAAAQDWADKSGAIGLGGNATLGGTNGLSVRTYLSSTFGLQLTVGFQLDRDDTMGVDRSTTQLQLGLYGSLKLAPFDKGHLSLLFGADFSYFTGDFPGEDDRIEPAAGFGLMGEWFLAQYFSIYAQAGLRITIFNRDNMALGDVSGVEIDLGSDLWGGAGFTVWFS